MKNKIIVDLRQEGHDENILYEVAHKDEWLAQKFPEAHIDGEPWHEPPPPLPTFYPETRARWSFLGIIKNEALNLLKI